MRESLRREYFRGTIVASLVLVTLSGCARQEKIRNVLVVTLDTTRADHLGCYGKESAATPHLDRIAEEGFLFEHALSSAPMTLPSHSTLFTGLYPFGHGVRDNGLFRLPDGVSTLAEILHDKGFQTAAAVGSFPVTRKFGMDQGFDFFDDHITVSAEDFAGSRQSRKHALYFDERSAVQVNDAILPWLRGHADKPFFAWIHYLDAHHPHVPPEPFSEIYRHDLYQGEIAYVDQSFGMILGYLETEGLLDETLVIVVGDHGEGRGEHLEESHSMLGYETTLRVPLLMRVPGRRGGVSIPRRVGTVDVLPTHNRRRWRRRRRHPDDGPPPAPWRCRPAQ